MFIMKIPINNCDCLEKLSKLNIIMPYVLPYCSLAENYEGEEGELCIVNNVLEDYGYYDDYNWVSNIVEYKEFYPIKYCPICGHEIEYKKEVKLTKNI